MVNSSVAIVLGCSTGSLILVFDKNGVDDWCQVFLSVESGELPLGAERMRYVAKQLLLFLSDSSNGLRWVFSLTELHSSGYGDHVDRETRLELQNADGKVVATLVLTSAERLEWIAALASQTADPREAGGPEHG
jgi:hypothetical protein